jgi:carboxymethylenebutenolidase
MVEVPTRDGVADAYLSQPDDGGDHAGVLFVIDAFGLRPQIETMSDRIAQRGFVVLAPNVFNRAGRAPVLRMPDLSDPENRASFFESLRPLIKQLTPSRTAEDGTAYLDYLEDVAPRPFAITGYCLGGRLAFLGRSEQQSERQQHDVDDHEITAITTSTTVASTAITRPKSFKIG